MNHEQVRTVRMVVLALLAMLVIPLSYRFWIHCHPAPEGKPILTRLQESTEDRRVELLVKPLSKWSAEETAAQQDIYAWLVAHRETVLPWEWSAEAREKDPKGHRSVWRRLFKDERGEIETLAKETKKRLRTLEESVREHRMIEAHLTNQVALATAAATNFPCSIQTDEMTRGRFWGWNHRRSERHLETSADLADCVGTLQKAARDHSSAAIDGEAAAAACRERIAGLTRLAEALTTVPEEDPAALRLLLRSIRAR